MSKETAFHVTGMHCVHCEEAVARALAPLPGLTQVRVSYRRGTVSALWDEALVSREEIRQALQKADYDLAPERAPRRMGAALRALLLLLAALALYGAAHGLGLSRYLNAFPLAKAGMGYGALFLLGVMTSLHCVAMCGGIGMAQSASAARGGRSIARANLLYNLGRVASYTLTGGLVGALGTVLSLSDGMKAAVQIVAAVFMIVMAFNLLGEFSLLRRLTPSLPKGLYARFSGKSSSSLALGLMNGLMPCGPLQAMQLYALSTGSAAQGALSMLLFSLGTVPLMLLVGLIAGRMRRSAAGLLRMASALLVFVMGLNMLAQGLALSGVAVSLPAPESRASAADGRQPRRLYAGGARYHRLQLLDGHDPQHDHGR